MSMAIVCGKDHVEQEAACEFSITLKNELLQLDPALDIQVYPDIKDYHKITCVLVLSHPDGVFAKFPNLKAVFALSAGVDRVLNDVSFSSNVSVARIIDPIMARDMVHYALAAVLNFTRHMDFYRRCQQQKKWDRSLAFVISEKTVGLLGLGFLGSEVAKVTASLGISTVGWSRTAKEIAHVRCYSGEEQFNAFLQATDVLICILPSTPETKNILNETLFAKLRDGAYLINMSRGDLLVEEDLISAIDCGKLSGACLDVFREEPLPSHHPFWVHPKITMTPHIAAITHPVSIAPQLLENYRRLQRGESLLHVIDLKKGY